MSAAERVQNHPVYVQAQGKASYYISQLDKEVISDLSNFLTSFSVLVLTRRLTAQQLSLVEESGTKHSSPQGLHSHRLRGSPLPSPHLQLVRRTSFQPPRLGSSGLLVPQGFGDPRTSGRRSVVDLLGHFR